MMQLLNNIWIALSSENQELVNAILIPPTFVENYLFMSLFLIILNVQASKKQKLIYVLSISTISIISSNFLFSPLNVFVNYIGIILLVRFIFKLNFLKSFIALLVPTFVFGLLNVLIQNPYITLLNITFETFGCTPIYRICFLAILYFSLFVICIFLKKFKSIKFSLDFLDILDKKTLGILIVNMLVGFLTLCIQLIVNTFYIELVPIYITLLSFLFLIAFFLLSIYSFTRMIKLATTEKELQNAEEYNKSLEILYDKVKGFKHDFNNMMSTFSGYLDNNDLLGAKEYLAEVKKDCKITNDLSILNPRIINNPGIYSLLNNKYFNASKLGINISIDFFLDLTTLKVNMYKFSRILGILLDNAIEAASMCDKKIVRVSFRRENKNKRAIVIVENTYSNKDVDTDKIFNKGVSGKENHSGIGLWEVKNYIKKNPNLNLFTHKTDEFFIQQLEIYDD